MAIRAPKRTQHCTICKNHGVDLPKKGHTCPHLNCNCLLCKLTKKAQTAMRHQQRVWRHQKQKLKSQKFDNEGGVTTGETKSNKSQACDKCRNHNTLTMKRNHKCPFQDCECEYCSLTFKRREIMKHQQRVRRSRITSQVESDGAPSPIEEPDQEEEGEYTYYQDEGPYKGCSARSPDDTSNHAIVGSGCKITGEPIPSSSASVKDSTVVNGDVDGSRVSMNNFPIIPSKATLEPVPLRTQHSTSESCHDFETQSEAVAAAAARESPPPLIHMAADRPFSQGITPREIRSVSSSPPSFYRAFDRHVRRNCSSRTDDDSSPLQYEGVTEELYQPPFVLFQRDTSRSSFRPNLFSSAQPLERLSALNASLEPPVNSVKFGAQLEDVRLRNYNLLPSTPIGPSFRNVSSSSSSILDQRVQQPLGRIPLQQPIRPMPLNMSHPRHPGNFSHQLWNHMFLPSNLGLLQNISESNLMRFQGIVSTSRFSSADIFHPA